MFRGSTLVALVLGACAAMFARLLMSVLLLVTVVSSACAGGASKATYYTVVLSRRPIVVGHDGAGHADPMGAFTVTVLNWGTPVSMAQVVCEFTPAPGLRIARVEPESGMFFACVSSVATLAVSPTARAWRASRSSAA